MRSSKTLWFTTHQFKFFSFIILYLPHTFTCLMRTYLLSIMFISPTLRSPFPKPSSLKKPFPTYYQTPCRSNNHCYLILSSMIFPLQSSAAGLTMSYSNNIAVLICDYRTLTSYPTKSDESYETNRRFQAGYQGPRSFMRICTVLRNL